VGRRVIVADNGAHGRIVKSGHGFFTVQASNGEEFMRRKEDLQMLDDADAIADDAEPSGIGARKPKKLPKRRAQVRVCVSVSDAGLQMKGSAPYADGRARMEATRRMRQEMIAQYLVRAKDRMEKQMGVAKRPNLADSLERILGADEEEDEYTPMLIPVAFCPTCRLEKESPADSCWNRGCWECATYTPGAEPVTDKALPSAAQSMFAVLASPRKPGFLTPKPASAASAASAAASSSGAASAPQARRESRFTAGKKRAEAAVVINPLVSYAYRCVVFARARVCVCANLGDRAPVKVLGAVQDEREWAGYCGGGWMGGDAPVSGWRVALPEGM